MVVVLSVGDQHVRPALEFLHHSAALVVMTALSQARCSVSPTRHQRLRSSPLSSPGAASSRDPYMPKKIRDCSVDDTCSF